MTEIEAKWQASLRKRFPGVIVRHSTFVLEDDGKPVLDIFMFPENCAQDFFNFYVDEYREFIQRESLPDCGMATISIAQTRENHPEIYAEAQREARRTGVARRTKSSKKSPAKKAARRTQTAAR